MMRKKFFEGADIGRWESKSKKRGGKLDGKQYLIT
jgi:hypothetical protein